MLLSKRLKSLLHEAFVSSYTTNRGFVLCLQAYNNRAFATAASDMLMKQVDHNGGDNVRFGDSFTDDQFAARTFDNLLTNPTFGVDWKKKQQEIQREYDKQGPPVASAPGRSSSLQGCAFHAA